ncbi:MAG: DegT/DnrJ/EryC1/StrS family aminotransferase [Candidatus Methylomirabilales bacterium]
MDVNVPFIPFLDLRRQYATIDDEIHDAIYSVLNQCAFASGPTVAAFEAEFARYCGVRYCVGVNSGTSALHLALIACGVGPGDEVITVPMTFIATAWAISYVGARPVFVDIEPDTCTLDVDQVKRAITSRSRAILPVHLYGQMAHLDPLLEICGRHGLALIEDAAQAHGAAYRGRQAGGIGRVGCFSFYPSKNLGAYGEGGAITTDDDMIAARVHALRDHAQSERYRHDELGFNYRMDEIQGAVLRVKLRRLDSWNAARCRVAARYQAMLADTPLRLPYEAEGRRHVWHLYVVRHAARDRLQKALTEANIGTGLHYPIPVHLQPVYAHLGHRIGDFPVAEQVARECLSLPIYPELSKEEEDRITQTVKQAIAEL